MEPEDRVRLRHIADALNSALRFTKGQSRADLDRDEMLAFALVRALQFAGEAARAQSAWPYCAALACGSREIEARIAAILELLRIQPHAGAKTQLSGVRRIFLTPYPYLIDHHVGEEEIVVLRFRHTSRKSSSIPGRA